METRERERRARERRATRDERGGWELFRSPHGGDLG